jgi:hypothetical protein
MRKKAQRKVRGSARGAPGLLPDDGKPAGSGSVSASRSRAPSIGGYALPMALGGLLGGYLGDMVSGSVNRSALRAVVMSIGFGVAAHYLWTLYGPAEFQIGGE